MIIQLRQRNWKKEVIDLRTPDGEKMASGKLLL